MTALPPVGTDRRAELLARLRRKRRQQEQERDQISAQPWPGTAALSSQQRGLWLAGELSSGDATYNMITVLRLRGPLEVRLLRAAFAGLISRHEGLRTSFVEQDGIPQMRVDPPPGQLWLEELDVSTVPEPSRAQRGLQLVTDCCQHPIDLRSAPLLRVVLVKLDAGDHFLGYVLHHIVSDGWSMPILAGELSEFYRAAANGRDPQLPALPIQPSDVYRWQRERLSAEAVGQRLDRWRTELIGLPSLKLPLDRPRSAAAASTGGNTTVELPIELLAGADELGRATGRSSFSVLLAAFAVLLQQRSGQYDLAIGSVFSGRVRTEMESLIGYFANTSALRIRTAADQPVGQLLRHCHDVLLEAQRMQDIPFADVVAAVAPDRLPGMNPLFQVCFTLARGPHTSAAPAIDGVEAQPISVASRGSRFDLSFQVTERADGTAALIVEYAAALFDESTVRRLAADYGSVLRAMLTGVAAATLTVSELQRASNLHAPSKTPAAATIEAPAARPVEPPAAEFGPDGTGSLREQLVQIWREIFELPDGLREDQNIFELGGTSLTAVRLRARIVSSFGVDIPLGEFYAGGSIAELLRYIEASLIADSVEDGSAARSSTTR